MADRQNAYDRLVGLASYIEDQIEIETGWRPSYNGTQRAIAYGRVLRRLKPIIQSARKVREALNFEELA